MFSGSLVRGSLVVVALFAGACSAPSGKGSSPSGNGGTGAPAAPEAPGAATQKGIITDLNTKAPIAGATVTLGDQTAVTAKDGSYALTVQKGEKFSMTVTADGYAKLLEQETALDADFDKGKTTIVPQSLATMLTGMLDGYDANLGVLSLALVPTGTCASESGATVNVTPAGSAKVAYFSGGIPSKALTAVKAGQFPSAVIYNVQPGVQLSITVDHGTCTQVPFPFSQGGVDYTGGISTQSGEVTGFARIFLQ